jgi:hypothetical protein
MSCHQPKRNGITVNIARSNNWACAAPAIQLNNNGPLFRGSRSKFVGQEVSEPYIVRRNEELSLVFRAAKQVYQTEKIDVIQTLERIIKNS